MLIGLTGKKGVGKDTVGQYLVSNYRFTKIAFADPLKQAVANLFGISIEEVDVWKDDREIPYAEVILQFGTTQWSWTWREFLQRFGTEMGRETFSQNFWVDRWQDAWTQHSFMNPDNTSVVATDVRFDNEAEHIKDCGGYVVEIKRPGHEPDGHVSEAGIREDLIDCVILNEGTKHMLNKDVDQLLEDIISGF
jgi:hypothetical protein